MPPIVFGGNVFGWTLDKAASFRILDRLVEVGLTPSTPPTSIPPGCLATRAAKSEAIIGEWLAARGNPAKVTIRPRSACRWARATPRGTARSSRGLSRRWIMESVDASLKRLRTDVIDLYQAHKDDPETPLEETLSAFAELIKAGKVRAIGASNYTAPRLKEALETSAKLGLPRYRNHAAAIQPDGTRGLRSGTRPALRQPKASASSTTTRSPPDFCPASTGRAADFGKSPRGGGMAKYLTPRGHAVLAALDAIAKDLSATPAQVALGWLLAKPVVTAPIASATNDAQIDDLVKAASLTLSAEAVAKLDAASA